VLNWANVKRGRCPDASVYTRRTGEEKVSERYSVSGVVALRCPWLMPAVARLEVGRAEKNVSK
jgi:hypothetical protein